MDPKSCPMCSSPLQYVEVKDQFVSECSICGWRKSGPVSRISRGLPKYISKPFVYLKSDSNESETSIPFFSNPVFSIKYTLLLFAISIYYIISHPLLLASITIFFVTYNIIVLALCLIFELIESEVIKKIKLCIFLSGIFVFIILFINRAADSSKPSLENYYYAYSSPPEYSDHNMPNRRGALNSYRFYSNSGNETLVFSPYFVFSKSLALPRSGDIYEFEIGQGLLGIKWLKMITKCRPKLPRPNPPLNPDATSAI